jgi:hypothetical protein
MISYMKGDATEPIGGGTKMIAHVAMPSETGTGDGDSYWSNLANIPWPIGLLSDNFENTISAINDDPTLDDDEREGKLRPLFKKIGYRLEFK